MEEFLIPLYSAPFSHHLVPSSSQENVLSRNPKEFIPSHHASPNCTICSKPHPPTSNTIAHFICPCPPKYTMWLLILTAYVNPSLQYVLHILLSDRPCTFSSNLCDTSLPLIPLSFEQMYGYTLQGIWQVHWSSIFQDTSFFPTAIISTIINYFTHLHEQLQWLNDAYWFTHIFSLIHFLLILCIFSFKAFSLVFSFLFFQASYNNQIRYNTY